MKNLLYPISTLLLVISSYACAKDKICTVNDPCAPTMRYFPMAVGNYWVYEMVRYNTATNTGTIVNEKDTLIIIGDTIIRNNKYFTFEENVFGLSSPRKDTTYLRDSIGYIVDQYGNIKFTAIDFDKIHYEWTPSPRHIIQFSVKDSFVYQLTPKGYFECLDFRGCAYIEGEKDPRFIHNYYSKDIGLIYENIFYLNPSSTFDFRRSLFDYHLE